MSDRVGNAEDWFSRVMAHMVNLLCTFEGKEPYQKRENKFLDFMIRIKMNCGLQPPKICEGSEIKDLRSRLIIIIADP